MEDHPGLRLLLDHQAGMITRRQLSELEVTRGQVRWALGRTWRAVLPDVIATFTGPLLPRQRLIAGLLHGGEGAMLGSATAATWHGVTATAGDPRVHVLAPDLRHPRSAGFVSVQRTSRPDLQAWNRGALTIASRARAVVDAARGAPSPDDVRAIVCEAVERRLVRPEDLRHEVEAGPVRGSAAVRQAVQEVEAGSWSVAEGDLLRLVARSRILPPVWANPALTAVDGTRLPTPDGWIDAVALAIQVHSRRWHEPERSWEATVMSDGVFAEYGIVVVAVTPRAVRARPGAVLAHLERAYRAAAGRPRPDVTARLTGHGSVGSPARTDRLVRPPGGRP